MGIKHLEKIICFLVKHKNEWFTMHGLKRECFDSKVDFYTLQSSLKYLVKTHQIDMRLNGEFDEYAWQTEVEIGAKRG